jgi:hypothetical protein
MPLESKVLERHSRFGRVCPAARRVLVSELPLSGEGGRSSATHLVQASKLEAR